MEVVVYKEETQSTKTTAIQSSLNFWKSGFKDYLSSGVFSDVVIYDVLKKHEYKLHRVVLVRKSSYFRKLLAGGFIEEGKAVVQVNDPTNSLGDILKYIYTGELSVHPKNIASLLDGADLFAVEGLTKFIVDLVQAQLDQDKDMIFIYLNSGYGSRLACSEYIYENFSDLVSADCFKRLSASVIKPNQIHEILSSDELLARQEDDVCSAIMDYVNYNKKELSEQDLQNLFTIPRYSYLKVENILKVFTTYGDYLPKSFVNGLMFMICQQNGLSLPKSVVHYTPRRSHVIFSCQPQNNTDYRGLFYWLGKSKGATEWSNPMSKQLIAISSSSAWANTAIPDTICANPPITNAIFWTNSEFGAWIKFDIDPKGEGLKFVPTHYYYGFQTNTWLPRNWNFEGSQNNVDWITLKTHIDDNTMQSVGNYLFQVPNVHDGYRYFRIRLTGQDSNGSNFVGLSFFELFGRISY